MIYDDSNVFIDELFNDSAMKCLDKQVDSLSSIYGNE